MRKHSRLMLGLVWVSISWAAVAAEEGTTEPDKVAIPPVVVQDAEGKPLAGAEVVIRHKERGFPNDWKTAGADGRVSFGSDDRKESGSSYRPGDYEVLVLARGKAPAMAEMTIPSDKTVIVTPSDGKEVELTIISGDSKPVPKEIAPRIYPQSFSRAGWAWKPEDVVESAWPEPLGDGRFKIELAEDTTAPYCILIQHPGILRGFQAALETTAALASGKVEMKLPKAGTVEVGISIPEKYKASAADKTFLVLAMTLVDDGNQNRVYNQVVKTLIKGGDDKTTVICENMAPGNLLIYAMEDMSDGKGVGMQFRKSVNAEVKAGQTATVAIPYKEVDLDDYKGNGVAEITVNNQDGSVAAGMPVRLTLYDRELTNEITLSSGTLTDQGTTTITGLKTPGYYSLDNINGKTIGRVEFRNEGDNQTSVTMIVPPFAGDMAPDVTLVDIETSQPVRLSDYRGKVVLLDFWATWCGACQSPMEHYQQLTVKNADKWKDKVVIVGASTDDALKTVQDHVKKKGWLAVDQLWCNEQPGTEDLKAPSYLFGVPGLPTTILIDANGKIVKRDPPISDIENEIGTLLKSTPAAGGH